MDMLVFQTPWYCPCACSAARSKLSRNEPDDCRSSPITWTSAPRASRPTAIAALPQEAPAKSTIDARSNNPAVRVARAAAGGSEIPREDRTWKSATTTVLMISVNATVQRGASVWSTTQSGIATSNTA